MTKEEQDEQLAIFNERLEMEREQERVLREGHLYREFSGSEIYRLIRESLKARFQDALEQVIHYKGMDTDALLALHVQQRERADLVRWFDEEISGAIRQADDLLESKGITAEEWEIQNQTGA